MQPRDIKHLIVDIDSITPHPKNVRHGDIGAISESLKAHGQYRPIVVDERTGQILAGNHTWKAAKALNWLQIQASFIETKDDDEALRILLADNKANDLATYNDDELINLLKQLAETDDGLEGSLFDGDDLDALIAEQEHFELPTDVDEIPEQVASVSKLGDVWLLGEHRVMCGSAVSQSDLDLLINESEIGLVLTDPPYGVAVVKDGKVGADFGVAKKGKYKQIIGDDSTDTAIASYELLKGLSKKQILWGGNYYANALPPSSCWLVWDKRGDSGIENTFADAELAWTNMSSPVRIHRQLWNGMIREGEHDKRVHPTQKPTKLLAWCIDEYAEEGCILDVFGGSGSTLIAAQETNRIAYLMELDPHYVDVICARYQKHTGNQPILEATGEAHNFLPDAN